MTYADYEATCLAIGGLFADELAERTGHVYDVRMFTFAPKDRRLQVIDAFTGKPAIELSAKTPARMARTLETAWAMHEAVTNA